MKPLLILFCCYLTAIVSMAADQPNIILVMADDQGWGDAGYTGYPFVKTPHMDAMAEAGHVFDRFYAAGLFGKFTESTGSNTNSIIWKVIQ